MCVSCNGTPLAQALEHSGLVDALAMTQGCNSASGWGLPPALRDSGASPWDLLVHRLDPRGAPRPMQSWDMQRAQSRQRKRVLSSCRGNCRGEAGAGRHDI